MGARRGPKLKLDAYDIHILEVLQRDGRITNQRLADTVHLSSSACFERVRRLESAGYISSYRAVLKVERLLSTFSCIVAVALRSHRAADFHQFEDAVKQIPEIVECHETGGGFDYIMHLVTADMAHYQKVIDFLLAREIGIERFYTYAVTKSVKPHREIPIRQLLTCGTPESEKQSRNSKTDAVGRQTLD